MNKIKIPYEIVERREGDIDECYSDPSKANNELNFKAKFSLEDMVKDVWNYEKKN